MYRFLYQCKFSFFWINALGVQLLGHGVVACLVFLKKQTFPIWLYHFSFPPTTYNRMGDPAFWHVLSLAVIIAILMVTLYCGFSLFFLLLGDVEQCSVCSFSLCES